MEPESSLPRSLQLATCPCPDPDQSSPCPLSPSLRSILILTSHLRLGLPSGLLYSGFPTKTLYPNLLSPHTSVPRPLYMIRNMFVLRRGVVSTSPILQASRQPLVGCPRLLIQYIRSYPPYLEAVPSSATWKRAMPWWQGPTYHRDRDPLITVTGTHLSRWQGPAYHRDRDSFITVTWTHLSPWEGPTYHRDRDPLITDRRHITLVLKSVLIETQNTNHIFSQFNSNTETMVSLK